MQVVFGAYIKKVTIILDELIKPSLFIILFYIALMLCRIKGARIPLTLYTCCAVLTQGNLCYWTAAQSTVNANWQA